MTLLSYSESIPLCSCIQRFQWRMRKSLSKMTRPISTMSNTWKKSLNSQCCRPCPLTSISYLNFFIMLQKLSAFIIWKYFGVNIFSLFFKMIFISIEYATWSTRNNVLKLVLFVIYRYFRVNIFCIFLENNGYIDKTD